VTKALEVTTFAKTENVVMEGNVLNNPACKLKGPIDNIQGISYF